MTMKRLLTLQLLYTLAGIMYNVISYIIMLLGGSQLSTTHPVMGFLVMSGYGIFLLAGYYGYFRLYRCLMGLSIVVFGYGGIAVHLIRYYHQPDLYASFMAWFLAAGINILGLVLNVYGALGLYQANAVKKAK